MMAELGCVATLRQLPDRHPMHELLMPHLRTALQVNLEARASLLAPTGTFDEAVASGLKTIPILLFRASAKVQYRSLCVPDDLMDRGVMKLPNSYYAHDALRVWDALHRFVTSWVDLYYKGDENIQNDSELQNWVNDITTHSFPKSSGFPQSFSTKAEACKFVTMFISSCSALHAAVNFSQLDFSLWMPNYPSAMMKPPPQVKGQLKEEDILSFLPDVKTTCRILTTLTTLTQINIDFVHLCHYREAIFTVEAHRRLLDEVQAELKAISDDIIERNKHLKLPYTYQCPSGIENSVAI
ncbi:hydroperoxide isomerase ALOXE3 [Austrofundulus limnaeus]|uniref:Hydroperoxide isomerase ALOXE3 n=1 Tax=Austrofundulus limnaeus TaxID=52670 RepID=A0A2I4AKR7_AUSLI|nr:PREDICTED: hydroperoxide isomerase ALOXE3-like [Austrofundulus limnaeus]